MKIPPCLNHSLSAERFNTFKSHPRDHSPPPFRQHCWDVFFSILSATASVEGGLNMLTNDLKNSVAEIDQIEEEIAAAFKALKGML